MKPSKQKLGHKIQQFLLEHHYSVEALAHELGMTPEGLSNLIHGRRRFKDETLQKLANTRLFQEGGMTLTRLKAYRAMDDYLLEEIVLAMAEYVRQGEIQHLGPDFFERLHRELDREHFPAPETKHALFALVQSNFR